VKTDQRQTQLLRFVRKTWMRRRLVARNVARSALGGVLRSGRASGRTRFCCCCCCCWV